MSFTLLGLGHIMSSVFTSQFIYYPLISMSHKRAVNSKISSLHKRYEAATVGVLLWKVPLTISQS